MKILGVYNITYTTQGVSQVKNLIRHSDFTDTVIPIRIAITAAESKNDLAEAGRLKKELNGLFGEMFFTDASPLWAARLDGILKVPKVQGGEHKCKIEEIQPEKPDAKVTVKTQPLVTEVASSKIKAFKSLVTGKEYDWKEYSNHGTGALKAGDHPERLASFYGKKDLPPNEYPYTLTYNGNREV